MKEYLSSLEEVLKEQNSSQEGLTTGEAQQRLSKYGKNELEKGKKTSLIQRFLRELADPMIIILIVAAAIYPELLLFMKENPLQTLSLSFP